MEPLTAEQVRELAAEVERLAGAGRWSVIVDRLDGHPDDELARHPALAIGLARALTYTGAPRRALNLALATEAAFGPGAPIPKRLDLTNLIGSLEFELGSPAVAEDRFADVVELAAENGDILWLARASNNLGAAASLRGRSDHALSLYRLALPAYQKLGDTVGLAETCHNIAITYRDLDHVREAEAYYRRAEGHARRSDDTRMIAMARLGRAELALRRGDTALAGEEGRRGLAEMDAVGDALGRADALRLLGAIALAEGRLDDADHRLRGALAAARSAPSPLLEAEVLMERAELHACRGDRHLAAADAQAARRIFAELGARGWERRAHEKMERYTNV